MATQVMSSPVTFARKVHVHASLRGGKIGSHHGRENGMQMLSYQLTEGPVREDFAAAHSRFWKRLAAPGAWWTGAERVAIAAEARHAWQCSLCRARQSALTPMAVDGEHDRLQALPEAAVDVIHRVITDPGRLSRQWFDRILEAGLSQEQYVEIIGTLVALISIDRFCLGIGVPLHELPQPLAGEPSHYRPEGLTTGEAWVPMLAPDHATGPERDLFEVRPTGNVIRAMSLVPDEVRTLNDLGAVHYLRNGQVRDPRASAGTLNRMQMELIAGRVSASRRCFY